MIGRISGLFSFLPFDLNAVKSANSQRDSRKAVPVLTTFPRHFTPIHDELYQRSHKTGILTTRSPVNFINDHTGRSVIAHASQ